MREGYVEVGIDLKITLIFKKTKLQRTSRRESIVDIYPNAILHKPLQ
jgi:hypothetical protein